MGRQAGDDIVESIAVDVVREQLGAADRYARVSRTERKRVKFPHRIARQRGRLLPPTGAFQQVGPAVPVDVTDAEAMRVLVVVVIGRNRVKLPNLRRVGGIGLGIAEESLGIAHQFRQSVAVDVFELRRFVVHHIKRQVPGPVAGLSPWVLEPESIFAGHADDEDVRPAVAVEVGGPGEEIVGVGVVRAERAFVSGNRRLAAVGLLALEGLGGWPVFRAHLEIGTRPPVGPIDDIVDAIVVEVAEAGSLRPEFRRELDLVERVEQVVRGGGRERQASDSGERGGHFEHPPSVTTWTGPVKCDGVPASGTAGVRPGVRRPTERSGGPSGRSRRTPGSGREARPPREPT